MESLSNRDFDRPHANEFDPPTPHCALLLSAFFCMMGGALILLAGVLPWVVDGGITLLGTDTGTWFLIDLIAINGIYNLFIAALAGGLMVIGLSIICLLTEKTHERNTWPAAAILTAFAITAIVAVTIFLVNGELAIISDEAVLGPAPFMAVFGCVLTLAGGSMLTLNTFQDDGMPQGSSVPISRLSQQALREKSDFNMDGTCPSCSSPVRKDWEICPACGTILGIPSL